MRPLRTGLSFAHLAAAVVNYGDVPPASFASGDEMTIHNKTTYTNQTTLTLSPQAPILTLDYGNEVAGFPFSDVKSISAPTQIEVKYAESFVALSNPNSDGPWTFSNGLSNTFRVETFNLSEPGRIDSPLLQGGQRWQTVQLLTNSTVEFVGVGMRSTAQHERPEDIPGRFKCSNDVYNRIWDLGARVVQVACVDAGNAPSTWQITHDGAYIVGQQTAQSVRGVGFGNYTLSFATKIVRGGTGWRVASGTTPYGAVFYLTSDYPEELTFLNTNRTLLPPNSLVFGYGYSIVNQTTVTTGWDQIFSIPMIVKEDTWYNISTTITATGYEVSIDNSTAAFVPISEAATLAPSAAGYIGSGSPYEGTWGFGPWQDQTAYIKDVLITARNGSALYSNPMTSDSVLAEYTVAPLDTPVCLDGAKRDRLVWIGDFYHTTKIIAASTGRWDYILGTIQYVFALQRTTEPFKGLVPISAAMGTRPEFKDAFIANYAALIDYQDLFLLAIADYFWKTGDSNGLKAYWPNVKDLITARLTYIDSYSGLVAGDGASYFLGPSNGTTVTALLAATLKSLVPLASAYQDTEAAELYTSTAKNLSEAINSQLWNPTLGTYSQSLDAPSNYSLTSMAWTILSGTANSSQAASMIAKLPDLRLGVGYKTSSDIVDSDTAQLSPNILGMLLEALFKANRDLGVQNSTVARTLLDDFWSKMVTQDEYYSGASWEYLYPDGSPGIDLFTSLAHPWGAAPTYVMPEYLLGVSATSPGYKTWRFEPHIGLFGLTETAGSVMTPHGAVEASWVIDEGSNSALVTVSVPQGTKGSFIPPNGTFVETGGRNCSSAETISLRGGRNEIRMHDLHL